jgi:hypothetical protein
MASVYERGDKWYVRYKDARGKWRSVASTARTKTEAKRLAGEIERKCERQRMGLEELPPEPAWAGLVFLYRDEWNHYLARTEGRRLELVKVEDGRQTVLDRAVLAPAQPGTATV